MPNGDTGCKTLNTGAISARLILKGRISVFKERNDNFYMTALTNEFLTRSVRYSVRQVSEQDKISPR